MTRAQDDLEAAEDLIQQMPRHAQSRLAVELATLVEPFASVSEDGQPTEGLPAVAAQIRAATSDAEVDRLRHILWSVPDVSCDDEPDGPAWFSLGATVAWIYAADSKCTSPSDGAINALKRTIDLLDCTDQTLGDTDLCGDLIRTIQEIA